MNDSLNQNALQHYGVKGMRWDQSRRKRRSRTGYQDIQQHKVSEEARAKAQARLSKAGTLSVKAATSTMNAVTNFGLDFLDSFFSTAPSSKNSKPKKLRHLDTTEYLEHYGVKGMKWGVRKDDEESKKNTSNRKQKEKTKEHIVIPYDNKDMRYQYENYMSNAKEIFDSKMKWGERLTEAQTQERWNEVYNEVNTFYSDLEKAMLAVYMILKENQMLDRFSVCLSGDSNDDLPQVKIYDMQTDEVIDTIDEALKRRRMSMKSREKNIEKDAKPVSVKKSEKPYWEYIKADNNVVFEGFTENGRLKHTAMDSLEHFGILGMKWGVRRYQNKDGTLTELGKKRANMPTREERKNTKRLKRNTAAAIKNLTEKGETNAAVENDLLTAKQNYEKASKKMYLFKENRRAAIKEASEELTRAFEMTEKPRAEMDRAREIYQKAAEKMLEDNKKMIEKYGKDTIKEVNKKNITYGITLRKSGFFSDEYSAWQDEVLDTGLTVVNIPWYGQRYTGKFVYGEEEKIREREFSEKAKKRY